MSEENGQHDAHVQVLTAEVRTLMVGSRQVTLSVYSQLDDVLPDYIEPFGRVSPHNADWWKLYVVGRAKTTGTLVRAWTFSERALEQLLVSGCIRGAAMGTRTPHRWRDTPEWAHYTFEEWEHEWSQLPLIVLAGLR